MQNGQETYREGNGFLTLEVYDRLVAQNRELKVENMYLKQALAQLKRMIFGSKSERHIGNDPSQLSLGLGVETGALPEKETEQITYTRNKSDNKKGSAIRLVLPSHLYREEHIIEPEKDITGARKIGEVVTEILEYTPGKFFIELYQNQKSTGVHVELKFYFLFSSIIILGNTLIILAILLPCFLGSFIKR